MKRGQISRILCAMTFVSGLTLSTGSALAAPSDPSGGQCYGLDATGSLFSTCLRAYSAANQIEVLTAAGAGEAAIASARTILDEAVATYAELSGGGTVPGFEPAVPILAVAFIDRDANREYNAATDDLIAKLIDTSGDGKPSAGDELITEKVPLNTAASQVAEFTVKRHVIQGVRWREDTRELELGASCYYDDPWDPSHFCDDFFVFQQQDGVGDYYEERYCLKSERERCRGEEVRILDCHGGEGQGNLYNCADYYAYDYTRGHPNSPSEPAVLEEWYADDYATAESDQPFLDVIIR